MYTAIITASGTGSRTGLEYNKMFFQINGQTVLEKSLDIFKDLNVFNEIIITVNKDDQKQVQDIINNNYQELNIKIVTGGRTRQMSVKNGIEASSNKIVFVHDGARPYLSINKLKELINFVENKEIKACALAIPVKDTISVVEDGKVVQVLKREQLMAVQTPQVLNRDIYLNIYQEGVEYTDESSMFAANNEEVLIFPGEEENNKITTKADIERISDDNRSN